MVGTEPISIPLSPLAIDNLPNEPVEFDEPLMFPLAVTWFIA